MDTYFYNADLGNSSYHIYHYDPDDIHHHDNSDNDFGYIYQEIEGSRMTYDEFISYQNKRKVVYSVLLSLFIIIGLVGNIAVVVKAVRKSRHVNSAFYVLLVNLCAASLVLIGFEYPLLLYENVFSQPWKMGMFFCQLHGYIQYCSFYGAAYALVLVLVFRLSQVLIPDRIAHVNNTCTAAVVVSIKWAVIMLANIPTWIGHGLHDEIEGTSFCYHKQMHENRSRLRGYLIINFLFSFLLPAIVMVTLAVILLYTKAPVGSNYGNMLHGNKLHRNTTIMLISLIIAFTLCWGPSNIFIIFLGFDFFKFTSFLKLSIISDVIMMLASLNPCINPWIIYLALRQELATNDRLTAVDLAESNGIARPEENHETNGDCFANVNYTKDIEMNASAHTSFTEPLPNEHEDEVAPIV